MRVSEIGEFELIRLLAVEAGLPYPPSKGARPRDGLLVDVGDDAVVSARHDGALIWTTDTLVAGVHFRLEHADWPALGWKSLAVNVSDIAAMGGTPDLALVTLALPPEFCVEDAQALYRGLGEAASAMGVTIGGGDIVRAPVFSITVAQSGWAYADAKGAPVAMTRGAARPGDAVAVTGTPGDSAGGLCLLDSGDAFSNDTARYLRDRHQRPTPRVALGRAAIEAGVRCAIDVSDGLVQDLGHIARASGVAIAVDAARLALSDALKSTFPGRARELALTGGEDYELLLVGPRALLESLQAGETPVTIIGAVSDGEPGVTVIDEAGRALALGRAGWDHFANR